MEDRGGKKEGFGKRKEASRQDLRTEFRVATEALLCGLPAALRLGRQAGFGLASVGRSGTTDANSRNSQVPGISSLGAFRALPGSGQAEIHMP